LKTRSRFSIDENGFVFLMVANVLACRRHDLLLESFSRVVAECPNSYLLLGGKGTDQEAIMRLSRGKQIKNIRAVGPVAFAALGPLFTASDAYVHSGGERYSASVEYAAIAGLPIITTPNVGAAKDYVIDGETGYIVSSEDVPGFAEKMIYLMQDRETAQRYGRKAQELASNFTVDWAAEQVEKAVTVAIGNGQQTTHNDSGDGNMAI
jgi:glycosyltransferase involved in cell wall biosynthesis